MSERIDISEETKAICDKFGLVYENVARLEIRPRDATAEVDAFADGRKRIDPGTGDVVLDVLLFQVET